MVLKTGAWWLPFKQSSSRDGAIQLTNLNHACSRPPFELMLLIALEEVLNAKLGQVLSNDW
jgi:hypothetical protein